MSKLAPNLFQRRFQDLMEIGRARLPAAAPTWTDHNAHDPGITLMELLAWVAEAQLYSLSRLRRDERSAYAALLGIAPSGTRAASGLLWPDRLDPNSPAATFLESIVIAKDAVINLVGDQYPTFRPFGKLLWAPGRIEKLETRSPSSRTKTDHTITNERGGLTFSPFGERAGRRDALKMTFACRDTSGLFGDDRKAAEGALWPIGVLVPPSLGPIGDAPRPGVASRSSLEATLVADDERYPLTIVSDSTQGFLKTGAILLNLDSVTARPEKLRTVTVEFRSRTGFANAPRVLRIEPNVIPIQQGRAIDGEQHDSNGMPDWSFTLDVPGLRFDASEEPATIQVAELAGEKTWHRGRLSESGPDDEIYEFDTTTGQVTFGNGLNGRIPPAGSQVVATYSVSDGAEGNVARNRKWKVTGIAGTFGVNLDPITGGSGSTGWIDERRDARERSRNEHALVSQEDIVEAAKSLPLFEVSRAWVVEPDDGVPRTGVVTLVAMRSRSGEKEPETPPENARWLEGIRRSLAARIPLATRLVVVAPHYVEFSIQAVLECEANRDPVEIKTKVDAELGKRLALVDFATGVTPRQPGVPVTSRDLAAWMRSVDGVHRVIQVTLRSADRRVVEREIAVPRAGLPRWNSSRSRIEVRRRANGRSGDER
jgi:hypothetical protein